MAWQFYKTGQGLQTIFFSLWVIHEKFRVWGVRSLEGVKIRAPTASDWRYGVGLLDSQVQTVIYFSHENSIKMKSTMPGRGNNT